MILIINTFFFISLQQITYLTQLMNSKVKLAVCMLMLVGISIYFNLPKDQSTVLYQQWKNNFGMKFNQQQDYYRMNIFMKNLEQINRHNAQPEITYWKGINQFTGLTQEEFEQNYLMKFQQPSIIQITSDQQKSQQQGNGPVVDWVSRGAVSDVRDQGACKATYAFSAIGAIEGYSVIVHNVPSIYSPQQLIDCSQIKGNSGCQTGTMNNCFDYIREYGIFTESQYPYHYKLQICSYLDKSRSFIPSKITAYNTSNTCVGLQSNLLYGPVSVAVDGRNFNSYSGGVFSNCTPNYLSLAALAVGMNDSFWTIKLSWGISWGQRGYMKVYRGLSETTKNTCGICNAASRPM